MKLQAFKNDSKFRAEMIWRAKLHREQDQYIKGSYGEENGAFRGCSVGCCVYDINELRGKKASFNDHAFVAQQLGLPEWLVHLQDAIFEGLPSPLNEQWTERMLGAIPVGADLSLVLPRFLLKTLDLLPETDRADVVAAIKGVREVLKNWVDTGAVNVSAAWSAASVAESAASAARSAARSAESAAESAASVAESAASAASVAESAASVAESAESAASVAASAAWSAARSAESAAAWSAAASAAWSAARSAESAAAWSAARSAAWEQIANDLIASIEEGQ